MEMKIALGHLGMYLGLLAGAGLLYAFGLVVYRVFFHPLAKYPGPFLAKITDAYQLYHAYKGDRHLEFWRMHQKYGKVVRFGPNSVSFNSNQSLKEIYGFKSNVRKAEFYDAFVHPAANTHNTRDKDVHARKRRVLSHAFSESAMKEMQRYILGNVRTFCDQIGLNDGGADAKGWTKPRNMSDWCNYLAMDILGDLSFGKAFHMLERPDNRFALELVEAATTRHLICGTMPIVDKLKIDKFLFPKLAAGRARYMAYSKGQLTERTKLGEETDRRDFFYYLLKARDPETGHGFTTPELWGESNLLIIAGSDTTSTAMAATLFYLVRNPHALKRVTQEIRTKFSDVEEIVHGPLLGSCTYLRACVDEAMRLSPSVGGILPREVLPGGITIDGQTLPQGTVVGTPHYTIHHNETYYPVPFGYAPERWLRDEVNPLTGKTTTEDDVALAQSAFCPFSIGPRGCIGKGLAYVEMTTTLARTIYLYDLRRAIGVVDPGEGRADLEWGRHRVTEFQLVDTFTSAKKGPMVEFRKVEKA
ncbi:Cytochrome P450 family protein, partial [Metarhizium majus ARSEF 297]